MYFFTAMALNVDKLREGLVHYRTTLERQRKTLRSEYEQVQRLFHGLFQVYGGRMSEEFQRRWLVTAQWFEEYLAKTAQLERFLKERTEQLRQL
jgi:hypothetical protein